MGDHQKKFAALSGLVTNPGKSQIFLAGEDGIKDERILQMVGFEEGQLSFHYLGVPLSSRKLRAQEYEPLIKKITSRISSWEDKRLTNAGKLQSVKSVLLSLEVYWCQIFLMPKAVIEHVESLLSGSAMVQGKVFVSWVIQLRRVV